MLLLLRNCSFTIADTKLDFDQVQLQRNMLDFSLQRNLEFDNQEMQIILTYYWQQHPDYCYGHDWTIEHNRAGCED